MSNISPLIVTQPTSVRTHKSSDSKIATDSQNRIARGIHRPSSNSNAQTRGVPIPEFVHVLNYDRLRSYMAQVPGPWVLKPRSEASAMGIKKIHHPDDLWARLNELGDRQSFFLLERFIPGDVYHVDSVVWDGRVVFVATNKYGMPPMTVYHGGGVFATSTLPYESAE